ncbi:IPTL-CTERM sorting domain-containing protein [Brevundimonas sp.]
MTKKTRIAAAMMAAAACVWAGDASAQTTIGNATIAASSCYTAGNLGTTGQTFVVPAGVSSISSVSIAAGYANFGGTNFRIGLRNSPGSAELYQAQVSTNENHTNASASRVLTIPGGGYPVTQGQTLFISIVDTAGGNTWTCYGPDYIAGSAFAYGSPESGDMAFRVVFNDTPEPVPTMTEWAMILLGLMLAGGAAVTIQRRRLIA